MRKFAQQLLEQHTLNDLDCDMRRDCYLALSVAMADLPANQVFLFQAALSVERHWADDHAATEHVTVTDYVHSWARP